VIRWKYHVNSRSLTWSFSLCLVPMNLCRFFFLFSWCFGLNPEFCTCWQVLYYWGTSPALSTIVLRNSLLLKQINTKISTSNDQLRRYLENYWVLYSTYYQMSKHLDEWEVHLLMADSCKLLPQVYRKSYNCGEWDKMLTSCNFVFENTVHANWNSQAKPPWAKEV
jgi:hypothetical protein